MKQSTLPFKPVKKTKKEKSFEESDESDAEINFESLSPPPQPRAPRRAAAGKSLNYLRVNIFK